MKSNVDVPEILILLDFPHTWGNNIQPEWIYIVERVFIVESCRGDEIEFDYEGGVDICAVMGLDNFVNDSVDIDDKDDVLRVGRKDRGEGCFGEVYRCWLDIVL